MTIRRISRLLTAALLAFVVAGCGGEEERAFVPLAPEDPGPVHVHALGVDPADGALFIATHTGLYRVASGENEATRVGELYQDTMGFTVASAGRFLGSGHPDVREAQAKGLPPLLGLVESTDGGSTWTPVSLLGEADFHVLRTAHGRLYGYDSTNGRLLVSPDGGQTWDERRSPGLVIDLVVHPADGRRLVAATERGLFASRDEGASWRRVGEEIGLLAWPEPRTLLLLDGRGFVGASADGGRTWQLVGEAGGQPAAFLAVDGGELYAALHDGTIKHSTDGGRSWTTRVAAR